VPPTDDGRNPRGELGRRGFGPSSTGSSPAAGWPTSRRAARRKLEVAADATEDPPHRVIGLPQDTIALCDALRRADTIGTARIVIATPLSSEGLWLAVLDPLRRATR